MAYRRALMEDIENIVAGVSARGSENHLRETVRWLTILSGANFQLSDQELHAVRQKLARVRTWLKGFDQDRRQKNDEYHFEMRKRNDEAILRIREQFRQILVSLLVDTERMYKAKLLELKKMAEDVQERQLKLAQQIRELEEELESNERQINENNARIAEIEESIARCDEELMRLLHKAKWLPGLRALCPHLSDQEFENRVGKVYRDASVSNDNLGAALVQELGLEDKQLGVAELLGSSLDLQESESRQTELEKKREYQAAKEELVNNNDKLLERNQLIRETIDDCQRNFLINSAHIDAGSQLLLKLVLDLRGKIKRQELSKGEVDPDPVDPKEMEYLNQIDAELARRNLPDEPHHVHDVIKSLIMKTAIAAALLEVPGRIAERQQELKSLRSEVGGLEEEIRQLDQSFMDSLENGDPVSIELENLLGSKNALLENYDKQQQALEKKLKFLSAPPEELQQRLENGDQELTKLLGIGIPCEPVPKVVVAAFLPEANKPKAKSEAEVSLVKSRKPEETLEDELKPKGFGLGLK